MLRISRIAVLICTSLFVSNALAVKLYKWVDEQGNVTYQDTPPPGGVGKVEEKEFDTEANVVPGETGGDLTAPDGAPGGEQEAAAESEPGKESLDTEALSAAEEEERLAREAEQFPDDGAGDDPGAEPEPQPGDVADPGTTAESGTTAQTGAPADAAAAGTPATPAAGGPTAGTAAGGAVAAPPLPPAAPAVGP